MTTHLLDLRRLTALLIRPESEIVVDLVSMYEVFAPAADEETVNLYMLQYALLGKFASEH